MNGGETLRVFGAIGFSMIIAATLVHLRQQSRDFLPAAPVATQPAPVAAAKPVKPVKPVKPTKPALVEQPLPESGIVRRSEEVEAEDIAPFQVVVPAGSPAEQTDSSISQALQRHYFVKLVDWESGQAVVTLFVRAGETTEIKVPIGKYRLRYASGHQWYGEKPLFGDHTTAEQAIDPLIFAIAEDRIQGHTIRFKSSMAGNMRAKDINQSDF
jgi:hypothetical protein